MYPLLKEILRGFVDALDGVAAGSDRRADKRLDVYVGHDTVVAPLLSALGAFDDRWPPLASRVVFELYARVDERDQSPALRVLYNGRDVTALVCPGHRARRCPLAAFKTKVEALLDGHPDFATACRARAP